MSRSAGRAFTERVLQSLTEFRAVGERVVVAVSGGSDSTALLVSMHALRRKKRLEVAAIHVNHALRGSDSDADEQFVIELCERLRVPVVCRRGAVSLDAAHRSEGLEETARKIRHQLFAQVARQLDARFVATAHTADDQAKTVLHHIIRGTALAGLAGIPAVRKLVATVTLIRPLLGIRRAEVLEFLKATGHDFREDRSNDDLTFTRNRVRHELLPYLAARFNPQVTESLTRLASLAAEAQEVIRHDVQRLIRRSMTEMQADRVVLKIAPLRSAPRFVLCELVRQLWSDQTWPLQELGRSGLTRIADVVDGQAPAWNLAGGVRAHRMRGHLILERERACS